MALTRREALQAGVGAAALGALAGCRPSVRYVLGDGLPKSFAAPKTAHSPAFRLLNRAGFGPRPGDLETVEKSGVEVWVEKQLQADEQEPVDLTLALSQLDVYRVDSKELEDLPMANVIGQLQRAQILQATYSRNQLRERMVDFWSNHFNIYAKKPDAAFRLGKDEWNVVRKHALGSFPEMLRSSAKSPAMLGYLDNQLNRKGAANENYARELLELHSLGVEGGYTQKDVQEVARCFSGWSIENRFLRPAGKLRFQPEQHDDGLKMVLGRRIPAGGGERDVDRVLEILSDHPSTAKFLAKKLCLYFLGERNASIERRVAEAYLESKGSMPAMLRPILLSSELMEGKPIVKRPFDFVVSAFRATDADVTAKFALDDALRKMGQPSHEWPMPDGFPIDAEAWTGSLLARWNFAQTFARGGLRDAKPRLDAIREKFKGPDSDFLTTLFFGASAGDASLAEVSPLLRQAIPDSDENKWAEATALCLCAPAFQWR